MENDNFKGLTEEEVKIFQDKYGFNEFVKEKKSNPLIKFLGVFKEPMFLLLIGAAALYFILGEPKEAAIMLIFVIFVATITFVQEWKTEKTVNVLKDLTSPKANVIRDGKRKCINSSELVPGDIIYISEGEKVPADCEVLYCSNLSVNESSLTGEAESVFKSSINKSFNENVSKDYWKKDHIYSGTVITFGQGIARVVNTGFNTEYGKISKAVVEAEEEITPLQKKVHKLVKNLAIAGFILCLLVIILSYSYNGNLTQSILSGITLAMAIIPEEFPVVLTVFLSLGALRLAKQNALMRKIAAVETLGSTTVLCVDKTGTITKNDMEVKEVLNYELNQHTNEDISFERLSILACEENPYDPMEKAIINYSKYNMQEKQLTNMELQHKISFDAKTKRMANIYKLEDKFYIAAKGSPESILSLCSMEEEKKKDIVQKINDMAEKGLRVLGFADGNEQGIKEKLEDYKLNFRGLIALQDPPKEGVKEAIDICNKAGIRTIMITGDYNKTAVSIGKAVGLRFNQYAITGEEIDNMTDEELCQAVKHCDVFSRVIPEHKMRIVKALKKNGEIVAMTGDGVNDAPALKSANIGVAMGKRGTEVAREAASMILMDDNFTTIVKSVKDGRRIFDNIRKAMVYIMVIHIPIIALALFSPLFNLPQILLPVHVVLLELIIDPTCSIIFELEEAEPNIMDYPPKSPDEPILTRNMVYKVLLQGASMVLASFIPFHFMVDSSVSTNMARSFALMTFIFSNITLVLVNRSNSEYILDAFKHSKNRSRLTINGIAAIMALAVVYIPFLQPVFKTEPLNLSMALSAIVLGAVSTGWWDIIKLYKSTIKYKEDLFTK